MTLTPDVPTVSGAALRGAGLQSMGEIREYEELEGAQGREIFFRPERYRPEDLLPLTSAVEVSWDGAVEICQLVDISASGVGLAWSGDAIPSVGAVLQRLTVGFDGHVLYDGGARVTSLRRRGDAQVVGVSFADALVSIDDVLSLRHVVTWRGAQSDLSFGQAEWSIEGHEAFRAHVAEFRLFLEDAEEAFRKMEADLPWSVVHGEADLPARRALIERLRAEFVPQVLDRFTRIDQAMRRANRADNEVLKAFSVRHLHQLLMPAPLLHRTRYKPLGYPGDFESMNYMYFRNFEGATLYGKALHLASCDSLPAQAVRARKDVIKARLLELARETRPGRPVRIASVAAGPAQETLEFLLEVEEIAGPIEIVLFDQDKQALSFAHRRLGPAVESHGRGLIKLVFLHDSIKRLLHDPTLFADQGPFDFIFSSGLYDYLRIPTAVTLTRNLHLQLVPGGEAYVGNMDPANPCRWIFEHHLDWTLIYRSQAEMLGFGRQALPDAPLRIAEDRTRINPFLVVTRT